MDVPPMIYSGNPTICQPGMTLFYHVMIGDSDTGYAMGVGHTLLVTEGAPEILTGLPDALTEVL
jgi:Xaa-Pro dipeptidase